MALKESNKDRKKRLAKEAETKKVSGVEGWISQDKIPYFQPTMTQTKWIIAGVVATIVALLIL